MFTAQNAPKRLAVRLRSKSLWEFTAIPNPYQDIGFGAPEGNGRGGRKLGKRKGWRAREETKRKDTPFFCKRIAATSRNRPNS